MSSAAIGTGIAISAGVGALGSIAGSMIQGSAAQNAAQDQEQADENAQQLQANEFNTIQGETSPFRNLGYGATGLLANLYGLPNPQTGAPASAPNYSGFENSPGYQFSVQQANQATNRQAAAAGNLYSTNTLQTIGANNAGYASQQYGNYVQQLMQMANVGLSGTGMAVQGTGNATTQQANLTAASGAAAGAGAYNAGSAYSSALGQITNPNTGLFSAMNGSVPSLEQLPNYGITGADSTGLGYFTPGTGD